MVTTTDVQLNVSMSHAEEEEERRIQRSKAAANAQVPTESCSEGIQGQRAGARPHE